MSSPASEERKLAEGLRRGDRRAFEAIYARELPYVMALLTKGFSYRSGGKLCRAAGLGSAFDAEDLCQEAFRRFFERCVDGGFDASRPVRPYLTRIVVNLAFKKYAKGRRETPIEDVEIPAEPAVDLVELAEIGRLIEEFADGLGERERAVFQGYFREQRGTQAEVATHLGLSRDQVARAVLTIRKRSFVFFRKRGWFGGP